jgi:hypothetical protein
MPERRPEHQPIEPIDQEAAEAAGQRNVPDELARVVLQAALHGDRDWAVRFVMRFTRHEEPTVRGNAVLGIGHLARMHGKHLSRRITREILRTALADPDPYVRGHACSARDDVETFTDIPVPPAPGDDPEPALPTEPLIAVGFWRSQERPDLPHPRELVGDEHTPEERDRIACYLDAGVENAAYLGYSRCRFSCGVPDAELGCRDLNDGVWLWPEGLSHYVRAHGVALPERFVATMRQHAWTVPREVARHEGAGRPSTLDFWIELVGSREPESPSLRDELARIARRFREPR